MLQVLGEGTGTPRVPSCANGLQAKPLTLKVSFVSKSGFRASRSRGVAGYVFLRLLLDFRRIVILAIVSTRNPQDQRRRLRVHVETRCKRLK